MLEPSQFSGRYFVPSTGVLSVFVSGGGRRVRFIRRNWPFIVTKVLPKGLQAQNTTTGHCLTLLMDEICACTGKLDDPPNYFQPLLLHLDSQIYWDACNLWKVPLETKACRAHRRDAPRRMMMAA